MFSCASSHLSSRICAVQEQVVVSPSSRLREARVLEVKCSPWDHTAQLVRNADCLTPAPPPRRPSPRAVC